MDNLWPRTIDRSSSPPGQILTQPAEQQAGATNSNPSSSAVHRALELPEILSHILLQLDEPGLTESQFSTAIEDLFIFQRVSRNWNAVIQDTLKLRRIMLLEYDEETSSDRPYGARYLLDPDTPALNLHPMLPCIRMEEEKWSAYRMRTEKQLIFTMDRYPVGPLEEHHTGRWLSTCIKCTSDGRLPQHFGHEDTLEDSKVLPRRYFSSINASWRRMKLFSRPKALSVEIYLTLQQDLRGTPLCGISFGIGPGQGVLGHLYDRLESVLLRDLEDYERAQLDHFEAQDAFSTALEDIEHMDAPGAELRRMREAHTEWGECHFESGDCAFCAAIDW